MSRDLLWLESHSFAAWGCAICSWIMPNLRSTPSHRPSALVRAAFKKHDCKKFPRHISAKEKLRPAVPDSDFAH
jgi:hypothetical protein